MKKINIIKLVVTLMAISFVISNVSAADRVSVFEMAESGLAIEFPVTATETVVGDSVIAGSAVEDEDIGI